MAFEISGRPITYRQYTGKTVSVSGAIEHQFQDTLIPKALVGPYLTDYVAPSNRYIDGDIRVRIKVSDLPESLPSMNSRIIADGREYAIASVEQSRSMLVVDLICRDLTA